MKGDLHFIQTKSGHLQLIYEPYIFVTDSVRSGRTFWRCMEYGKRCRARITSKNNILKVTNPVHNHPDNHMRKIARSEEGAMRYTVTQRGAPCLMINGFGFVARKRRGPRVYWTCRHRRQFTCQARALTNDGQLTMSFTVHNHPLLPSAEFSRIESLIEVIAVDKNFVRLCVGPGGRPRLWVRGKSFYAAHTMRSGIVRWRCTMGGCGCKAYTQKGKLHKLMGEHNHENRWKRKPVGNKSSAQYSSRFSNSFALPRVPQLDFDNFDPSAWVTPY